MVHETNFQKPTQKNPVHFLKVLFLFQPWPKFRL